MYDFILNFYCLNPEALAPCDSPLERVGGVCLSTLQFLTSGQSGPLLVLLPTTTGYAYPFVGVLTNNHQWSDTITFGALLRLITSNNKGNAKANSKPMSR